MADTGSDPAGASRQRVGAAVDPSAAAPDAAPAADAALRRRLHHRRGRVADGDLRAVQAQPEPARAADLAIRGIQYSGFPQGVADVSGVVRDTVGSPPRSGNGARRHDDLAPAQRGRRRTAVSGASGQRRSCHAPPSKLLKQIRTSGQRQLLFLAARANAAAQTRNRQTTPPHCSSGRRSRSAMVALLSIGLAWWLAGRALRPLRTMNTRAREISAESLHQRLGVDDRRDELGELATTFDALLGTARVRVRLAASVRRQRLARTAHADHAGAHAGRGRARRSRRVGRVAAPGL